MKHYKSRLALIISSSIILAACITQEPQPKPKPQHKWVKTKENNESTEFAIADGMCLAESYKAIPMSMPSSECHKMDVGFARGACRGQAARQKRQMKKLRTNIYDGCMLKNSWGKSVK